MNLFKPTRPAARTRRRLPGRGAVPGTALTAGLALIAFAPEAHALCAPQEPLRIVLARDTPAERDTRAQLERLVATYDVSRWIFTCDVVIDESRLPHSHPVLTLHTRHLLDDDLLLSTFLHEQLHWRLVQRPSATDQAVEVLQGEFPDLPIGFPAGSQDAWGNYVHLIIGLLEWSALKTVIGEMRARAVITFWSQDHYTAIYGAILDNPERIAAAIRDLGLPATSRGDVRR